MTEIQCWISVLYMTRLLLPMRTRTAEEIKMILMLEGNKILQMETDTLLQTAILVGKMIQARHILEYGMGPHQ